jgi:hypothetical protein
MNFEYNLLSHVKADCQLCRSRNTGTISQRVSYKNLNWFNMLVKIIRQAVMIQDRAN